ncbi:MAG: DUF2318 domain-containing protein [Acidobacteriota bacterium]|nr:DUF2318 domain-containing protein [Acidobacteriota bacterium]
MINDREQRKGQGHAREEKRSQFTRPAGGGGRLKPAVLVLALAAVAGYLVFANLKGGDDAARPTRAADVKPAGGDVAGEVRVPLKDLEGGKAVFFEPKLASGKPVRFFVVRAADNTYRAALDACEVCFHAKKGYHQKGADMVCRNCGRNFAIADIGPHNEGGCNPVALTQKVEGDSLVIKTSELENGSSYF